MITISSSFIQPEFVDNYFWDVVVYSIRENQQEIFEHLLCIGDPSDFFVKKLAGKLPIELASSFGRTKIVELLLEL